MKNDLRDWSRTKIVATIGPATEDSKIIKRLLSAGMDVARLNFSHGSVDYHSRMVKELRKSADEIGSGLAIMQDLPGPKIRIGEMPDGGVFLKKGAGFSLTGGKSVGNSQGASLNYPKVLGDVHKGARILLDDGRIELKVTKAGKNRIECHVDNGGVLTGHKGVNFPGVRLSINSVTRHDLNLLDAGLKMGVDMVALSFVRSAGDVTKVRKHLSRKNKSAFIISKIEKHEAVDTIDEIIGVSDAIMVARGDLGVEMPLIDIPGIQKMVISKCNAAAVPVITATQVLESMINNPSPTRAEVTDAANAVYDGTDALMLSGETSIGKYPVESVKFINAVTKTVEADLKAPNAFRRRSEDIGKDIDANIGMAAARMAKNVGASLIVTPTRTGRTARLVSRFRPAVPIVALTKNRSVAHQLQLSYGVVPILIEREMVFDGFIKYIKRLILDKRIAGKNSSLVICSGSPESKRGRTNLVTIETI